MHLFVGEQSNTHVMNEALMTALAETLIAAEEALDAAQAGRFDEARRLLVIVDEGIESGQGGNAAHAARRRKILRLESEVRALLPVEETPATNAAPADAPAELEVAPAPRTAHPRGERCPFRPLSCPWRSRRARKPPLPVLRRPLLCPHSPKLRRSPRRPPVTWPRPNT